MSLSLINDRLCCACDRCDHSGLGPSSSPAPQALRPAPVSDSIERWIAANPFVSDCLQKQMTTHHRERQRYYGSSKINRYSEIRHWINGRQFEYLNFCLSGCVYFPWCWLLVSCAQYWNDLAGLCRAQAVGGRGWWGSTWSSFVTCKQQSLAQPSRLIATRSSHVFTRNISIKSVSIKSKNCIDISLSLSHISVRLQLVRGHKNTWHIKCFYKNRIAVSE